MFRPSGVKLGSNNVLFASFWAVQFPLFGLLPSFPRVVLPMFGLDHARGDEPKRRRAFQQFQREAPALKTLERHTSTLQ